MKSKTYLVKPECIDTVSLETRVTSEVDDDSRPSSRGSDLYRKEPAKDSIATPYAIKFKNESSLALQKSVSISLTRIACSETKAESERDSTVHVDRRGSSVKKRQSDVLEGGACGVLVEGGVAGLNAGCMLTKWEVDGLLKLVGWMDGLMQLSAAKRGVPKDVRDPVSLLRDFKVLCCVLLVDFPHYYCSYPEVMSLNFV